MAFLIGKKPTISKTNSGLARGAGMTLLGNMPAGNYTLITNPVNTKSGTIIDAADTQTISYSSSMKKAAQELAKSGNPIEKAAANYYLYMDDPTKKGSAKYYENLLKKAGIDINAKSNTGNPVGDFALDVVKGFVGSPAQTGRALAGGGLGAVLLSKTADSEKASTLKSGGRNLIDSTITAAVESPGQLVGGALAGVAGVKGLGILTKKPSIPQTIKTSDFKQTGVTNTAKTLDADYSIKGGTSYKYKNKTTGGKRMNKNSGIVKQDKIASQLNKNIRQDRGKAVAKKVELGSIEPVIDSVKIDLVNNPLKRNLGLRVKTVKSSQILGSGGKGRSKVADFEFDVKRNQQNALITAKEARTPRNNSRKERSRVRQVVEVQKKSGAIFQDMKLKLTDLPKQINQWGLVTAEEARKPKNRSIQERRRVQKVKAAQQKVGAAKPAASRILDAQNKKRGKTTGKKKTGEKKTTVKTRRPRAFETKVTRISRVEGAPGIYAVEEVPRYAAGASRPITIQAGGRMVFTPKDVFFEPTYNLKLQPASTFKQARMQKAVTQAKTKTRKKPAEKKGAGAKAKARAESPRRKKTATVEFEKVDTDRFVQARGRSGTAKKSSGTAAKKQRPANTRKRDPETVREVDNGNGTVGLVRVKTTKADSKPASAKTKAKAEKPKGKVRQKTASKTKPAAAVSKQTRVTGDKSTKTAEIVKTQTKKQTVIKPTSEQRRAGTAAAISLTAAGGGSTVNQFTDGSNITIQQKQDGSKPAGTTPGKTDNKTRSKTLTVPKTAQKTKTQAVKKNKATRGTPKTKTKKTSRLRLKEEEKKKKKRVVKVKDDSALRLETVNQFGWLGIDKKPAAKPRRVK